MQHCTWKGYTLIYVEKGILKSAIQTITHSCNRETLWKALFNVCWRYIKKSFRWFYNYIYTGLKTKVNNNTYYITFFLAEVYLLCLVNLYIFLAMDSHEVCTHQLISYGYDFFRYGYDFFLDTILLLHIYGFEGYLSQYKIDKTVNNHLNTCK